MWYMVGPETALPAVMLSEPSPAPYTRATGTQGSGRRNTIARKASPRQLSKRAVWQSSGKGGGSLKHFRVDWNEEVEAGAGKSTS